jgi:hypothetical protein
MGQEEIKGSVWSLGENFYAILEMWYRPIWSAADLWLAETEH